MEVTYTPGEGLLLGAGNRWLLLGPPAGTDPHSLDELWGLLTGPAVDPDELVARVDALVGAETSLAYVDTTFGAQTTSTRGAGVVSTLAGVHTVSLGAPDAGGHRWRLVGGIVGAGSAVLRPGPTTTAAPARVPATRAPVAGPVTAVGAVLIDGIPPEILAASAPSPPRPAPPGQSGPPSRTDQPPAPGSPGVAHERTVRRAVIDSDHDGQTTYRPGQSGVPVPQPLPHPVSHPVAHLRQTTQETVLAVHCMAGHVTAAYTPTCRVCAAPVPAQDPQRVPRPRLGVLHLPDGETVPLDRGVVIGRLPAPDPARSDWPHLVRVPDDATFVSRSHLYIELDGWLVLATDLGSRGGTTLRVPGRPPERIRAHEPYVWEPGQVLDLSDSYELVYEVTA